MDFCVIIKLYKYMIPINRLAGIISQNGIPVPIVFPTNNKYRFQQSLLFQRAHTKSIPFIYTNHLGQSVDTGTRFYFDGQSAGGFLVGPTQYMLCPTSRWSWKNYGTGDWIDANGIQQGSTPFSQSALLPNGQGAAIISINVTTAMQYVYTNNRWCAFLLKATGSGEVGLVGPCNPTLTKSIIQVNYSDGTSEILQNWVTSALRPSTAYTDAMDDIIGIGVGGSMVIEFFRPTLTGKTISSATMNLSSTGVSFGTPRIQVYVCAPTVPNLTQIPGLAQNYNKDAGIASHPSVIVNQLVTDSTGIYDVLDIYNSGTYSNPYVPGNIPTSRGEYASDPTLWGTPGVGHMSAVPMPTNAQLNNLYPRKGFGKWVGTTYPNYFRVVHSDDTQALANGFTPLATGLGAIELTMPGRNIPNGGSWFASGESGTDVDLLFDRARIGQVSEIYIRYYVQLGSGWEAKDSDFRMHFMGPYQQAGKFPEEYGQNPMTYPWRATDFTGKFFGGAQHIASGRGKHYTYPTRQRPDGAPDDSFTYPAMGGGYGATSGALGYQGRCMFQQGFFKENFPGPAIGGMAWGIEMYDFQDISAIPSQSFISGWDGGPNSFAGANGGIGFLYPGKWYCLELRWKLNTLAPYVLPPRGTDYRESGFLQDGFLEYYVDGILANTSPTFAIRRNPMLDWAVQVAAGEPFDTDEASPHYRRPITNVSPENWMGFATVAGNLYYGGRSPNPRDKKVYINGIVASTSYVGPMAGISRDNGGLGVAL